MNNSKRRPPRQRSEGDLDAAAFRGLKRERQRAASLFNIDIERSFRDWMQQLTGRDDFDVEAHGRPTRPASEKLDLTRREKECLSLVACGYSRQEAGDILSLSMETVKSHMRSALPKLGAKSNTQAVMIAALVGELDHEVLQEHLFREWESPGLAAPGTPIAA